MHSKIIRQVERALNEELEKARVRVQRAEKSGVPSPSAALHGHCTGEEHRKARARYAAAMNRFMEFMIDRKVPDDLDILP